MPSIWEREECRMIRKIRIKRIRDFQTTKKRKRKNVKFKTNH